jgi:hypothetical protein
LGRLKNGAATLTLLGHPNLGHIMLFAVSEFTVLIPLIMMGLTAFLATAGFSLEFPLRSKNLVADNAF